MPEAPLAPEEPAAEAQPEDAPAENGAGQDAPPPVPAEPVAAPRSDRVESGLLERALAIALDAHQGQTDRAGRPYVFHPLRLMHRQHTDAARMAALLHDVVEDSGWTLERLRDEGFPDAVVDAVDALTHREDEGESYEDYVARAARNPLARQIKRADLEDNMDIRRLGRPLDEHDLARLERYRKAWQGLGTGD
ncbi:MAG: HD domain-containing protein [Rhodothermales bacterium]|nr:HD domain-containing protein [Rhodothermales bacterium]